MKKLLFIIFTLFLSAGSVHAADVSVVAPKVIENPGQFTVLVNLDTGGATINSIDITLSYPTDLLLFKGYKEEGTIKKMWLMSPKEEDGSIHFSGIIPGGVDGVYDPDKTGLQPIPLAILLFSPKENGSGSFTITHSEILQNDGFGTSLLHATKDSSLQVSLVENPTYSSESSGTDTVPPEPFMIEYIPSGLFSKTPSMISFRTIDLGSGVEKYQVKKVRGSWKDVVSPLPTPKGLLSRDVVVRALDFNGNSREAMITIPGIVSPRQLGIVALLCVASYFLFFVVKRKR